MNGGAGWIGHMRAVNNYLRVVGADQDEEGKFILTAPEGSGLFSFLGLPLDDAAEVIIPGDVEYFVNGHRSNLAAGLRSTSSGLGIYVI